MSLAAMDVPFSDYLEAKFTLDERSINPDVRRTCFETLEGRKILRWLDVGSGTGAMLRRLLTIGGSAPLNATLLDRDASLLAVARREIAAQLAARSGIPALEPQRIDAEAGGRRITVEFCHASLFEFEPDPDGYDLITAHGFLDIVPLARTLDLFGAWIKDDGVLYATLNYDGDTALFAPYPDEAFETRLLTEYDASMERRRVDMEAVGGARSGRRLHSLLERRGWRIEAYGSSDWNVTPLRGRYRDQDATVLRALLAMIHGEGLTSPAIDADALAEWYRERMDRLSECRLGMIIHQMDLMARPDPACSL